MHWHYFVAYEHMQNWDFVILKFLTHFEKKMIKILSHLSSFISHQSGGIRVSDDIHSLATSQKMMHHILFKNTNPPHSLPHPTYTSSNIPHMYNLLSDSHV